jgi:hypothetical protein
MQKMPIYRKLFIFTIILSLNYKTPNPVESEILICQMLKNKCLKTVFEKKVTHPFLPFPPVSIFFNL